MPGGASGKASPWDRRGELQGQEGDVVLRLLRAQRPGRRAGGEGQSVDRASHRGGEVGTPSEDVWEPLEGFKQGRELRVSLDVLKGDLDGCVESKQRGISEVESGKPASIVT